MEVRLIDLGRNNVNTTVWPKDWKALERDIARAVVEPGWQLQKWNDTEYYVLRDMDVIGKIKIVKE